MKEIRLAIMEYMKLLGYKFDEELEDYGTIYENKKTNVITEKDNAIIDVFKAIYEKLEEELLVELDHYLTILEITNKYLEEAKDKENKQ